MTNPQSELERIAFFSGFHSAVCGRQRLNPYFPCNIYLANIWQRGWIAGEIKATQLDEEE